MTASAGGPERLADEHVDPLDRPDAGARVIRGGVIRGIAYAVNILLITATVPLMTVGGSQDDRLLPCLQDHLLPVS